VATAEHPRPSAYEMLLAAQGWADHNPGSRILPVNHKDGQQWSDLPIPARWHRCWPQSWGSCGPFEMVERCPCGGTRLDMSGPWMYRNRRRLENYGTGPHDSTEMIGDDGFDLLVEFRHALRDRPELPPRKDDPDGE
jgi:hypothetical protein